MSSILTEKIDESGNGQKASAKLSAEQKDRLKDWELFDDLTWKIL